MSCFATRFGVNVVHKRCIIIVCADTLYGHYTLWSIKTCNCYFCSDLGKRSLILVINSLLHLASIQCFDFASWMSECQAGKMSCSTRLKMWIVEIRSFYQIIIIIMTCSIQLKPPSVAIVCQNGLSSTSCRASVAVTPVCVTADLVNPGGGWPTTGTSSFLRWPLAAPRPGADSKDLIGWYGLWESGNVAE